MTISTTEKKQAKLYVLTVLKDGEYQELTPEEMEQFTENYPEIASFWQDPEMLQTLWLPKEDSILYDSWDQVAKRIINHLWRMSSAKIFHEPVDAEKLGASDYHDIVKNPVDFGTIK